MVRRPGPLRAVLAAAVLLACEARATPPHGTVIAATEANVDRFRPLSLVDSAGTAVRDARLALDRDDAAAAKELVLAALDTADLAARPRLRYLLARAHAALGDQPARLEALATFEPESTHPLAPYAALELAAALETTEPARAVALVTPLAALEFPARARAQRLLSRLRLAQGDGEGSLEALLSIADAASGEALAEVAAPAFEALLARGDAASLERALRLAHRVYAKAPRTSEGRMAETRMREIARRLPSARGDETAAGPTLEERIERANGLAATRVEDAVAAFDEVLERLPEGDARTCAMRFGRAKAIDRGRDKGRAATELIALADACDDPEIRGFALFKAARAQLAVDQDEAAVATFTRLFTEARTSRFADDGAVALARFHLGRGETELADAVLRAAMELPAGDMRAEAFFMVGYAHRKRGEHADALRYFRAAHETGAAEQGEENAGRCAYWEARTLQALGRTDEATAAFETLASAAPLTYYGLSALSRLDELDATRAATVRRSVVAAEGELELPLDRGIDRDAFWRAGELLFVGERDHARAELAGLGFLEDGASDDAVFLAASLYVATDHPNEAVELVRRRLGPHRAATPVGFTRAKLRLGYPRAFDSLVEDAAQATGVPATFVRAIAREESSFDPSVVSRANAIGLIQILPSTARGFARDVGFAPTVQNLKEARTNLAFGTRFMARLFTRFDANPGLVPAAYNAGHGSVERWLRADSQRPFDEFVEEIPYEETRRYTRRVLQSYGVYELLDAGRLPTFSLALPVR